MARAPRRRRADNLSALGMKLGVDERHLDRKSFSYRWVNEDKLELRTESDDWEKAAVKTASTDMGSAISRIVGRNEDGSPKRAYLCAKPRKLFEEDRATHDARVRETMTAIRGGNATPRDAQHSYIPSEGITLRDE
jgi:hypothetical protein